MTRPYINYSADAAIGVFRRGQAWKLDPAKLDAPSPSCLVPALLRSKCLAMGSRGLRVEVDVWALGTGNGSALARLD